MQDILGQEIKVGSLVIPTNASTFYTRPLVVTRIGSSEKIQLDGCSYGQAAYMVEVSESFKKMKGQEAFDALIEQHREAFNYDAVTVKPKAMQYAIVLMNEIVDWEKKIFKQRFFLVGSNARTLSERNAERKKKVDSFFSPEEVGRSSCYSLSVPGNITYYGNEWGRTAEFHFRYSYDSEEFSTKRIKLMNLEKYIDSMEIPDVAEVEEGCKLLYNQMVKDCHNDAKIKQFKFSAREY